MRGPRRPGTVPLDRALSKLGFASRAEAQTLIREGRVTVDGRQVVDPARAVVPERIRIKIDDQARARAAIRLIAFHKPREVVTTRRDPEGRKTAFDVLGHAGDGLIAVGRLDMASTGLLLLTNDTQLANRLTDPASRITRTYLVTVRGRLEPDSASQLEAGIDVRGARGQERLSAARVTIRKTSGRESHATVELTEGRNREIRRLFEAIGHEVTRLHRIAFGPYELGDLHPGEWRDDSKKAFTT